MGAYEYTGVGGGPLIYVNANATGNNNGLSWEDAFISLQYALLLVAQGGDEIWVAEGTYYPTFDYGLGIGDRGKHFRMKKGVAIYGGFPDTGDPDMSDRNPNMYETILSGDIGVPGDNSDNCYHVFYHPAGLALDPNNAILDGFTITAGIANGSSWPHILGGGMFNDQSSPTVTNCTFAGNSARAGSGIFNYFDSNPNVTNCIFSGNWAASDGGGMCNEDNSSPTVTNCTFTANWSDFTGGGGGGMYNSDTSNPTVTNCTFTGNSAFFAGGGMFNRPSSNPTVTNCIMWGNAAVFGSNDEISGPATVSYSCVQGGHTGTGNIDSDPNFADPDGDDNILGTKDDNLRLLAGSPCIDAGDSNSVGPDLADLDDDGNTTESIPWDLDGHNRFVDDPCTPDTGVGTPPIVDMGAYERGICGDADHPYSAGDINSDCAVDIIDTVIMALAWLSEDGGIGWDPACNLYEADSVIDASDFSIIWQHWLECTKPDCD
jgi:hypothetical protein